jgi:hypothetical protein
VNAFKWYISKFPESLYPCGHENQEEYNAKVILGRQKMSESTVVICGIARDISQNIIANIARIERLGKMFDDYRVVIYENNSTDGTDELLKEWEKSNRSVTILSEKLGSKKYESSTEADYRNNYLEEIFKQQFHLSFRACRNVPPDYVIVADLDLKGGWSYEGICNSFGYDNWNVMGSNGLLYGLSPSLKNKDGSHAMTRVYYDSLAFRRIGHPEQHVSSEINALAYNRGEDPFRVLSCFGGLALYKYSAFQHGARYSGPDCDHVELHSKMLDVGIDDIYLNPSQIVLYSNTHYTVI